MKEGQISDLLVLDKMASKNKNIRCATNLVSVNSVKQGGIVGIGVDRDMLSELIMHPEKYLTVLYVSDKEQFFEIKNAKHTPTLLIKSTDFLEKKIEDTGHQGSHTGLTFHVACKAMEDFADESVKYETAKQAEALDEAVKILALLVRCKEIKDLPDELKSQADIEFYNKCKPLAWMKAKAFLTL